MKKKSSRIVALVLTLCMVFFGLPVAAMAEGGVSINGTPYESIAAAIKEADDNDVIEINESIVLNDPLTIQNKSIVLDLNGNDISCSGRTYVLDIHDSTVEIRNGTVKSGTADNERPECIIWCNPGAHLVIAKDAVVQTSEDIDYCIGFYGTSGNPNEYSEDGKSASLTVNGSLIGGNGLTINGNIRGTKDDIQIEVNGKITAEETALYLAGNGTTTITDSAQVEGETGVEIRAGYLSVKGGTITGTGNPLESSENPGGTTTVGAGIAVVQHTTKQAINVVVSGGDISGYNALYEANTQGNSEDDIEKVSLSVTGGTLSAINGGPAAVYSENKTAFITGGNFTLGVKNEYLTSGVKQDEEGNVVPDEGINFVVNGVGGYNTLDRALAAANAAEDGSVITLWNDVTVSTDSALKIQKDITITSAGAKRNTITLTNTQGGRAKTIVMTDNLTLDNVALTLAPAAELQTTDEGNGDGIQMGNDLENHVTLTLKNGAVLTFANNGNESVQNAFVMPAGPGAKVIVDGSKIIAQGVDGNFSNGGIFTIQNDSEVNINDCASYGLSVNGLTVDNSNLTIDRTVLSAIRTSSENAAVKVVNRGKITVTNSGGGLPHQSRWGDAKGVIDIGHSNSGNATVPATLTVDEKSSIVLKNNKEDADFVYLTAKASYAVSGEVTEIRQEELPENYYSITYTVNGDTYAVIPVSPGETASESITFTEPDAPVVSGYTFQKWNYPDGTNVEDGTVTFPVEEGKLAYTVTASLEKKPTPSTSDDDGLTLGYKLPFIGETTGGKNFVSDTTSNLTVNGKYQFRITSTDGHKPVMTVSNANFTVELASQSGNDYFYVIRCAGAAGSTANVLVDGYQVVVATVGTAGVVSDTTHPFTVAQGATYQFKLTSASRPTFTGNNANFTIAYVSNSGNDWFFKVTAAGAAGASTTFSANGVVVTTATIA